MSKVNSGPMKRGKKMRDLKEWLDDLRQAHPSKLLTAAAVVEAARDKDSPAHKEFDWNDSSAARKYRLSQAGALIRRVYVIEEPETKSPAFLSLLPDRERPGGGYRATSEIVSSKALRAQLELTAKAELRSWTERYQVLSKLVGAVAIAAGIAPTKKRSAAKK